MQTGHEFLVHELIDMMDAEHQLVEKPPGHSRCKLPARGF
jgi:hypothetical protein